MEESIYTSENDSGESVPLWVKITLIFLAAFFLFLGTVVYLEVYGIPGSYTVTPTAQQTGTIGNSSGSLNAFVSSSPWSPLTGNNPTLPLPSVSGTDSISREFATPPVSWTDSGATFSLTAAALQNNKLTFTLRIQIGGNPTCVPLNLRLVANESGDLQGPDTLGFAFEGSGNCNGTAGTDYQNQNVTFSVDPANFPLLFTTNNGSSTFFEIATTTGNGIQVELPGTAG